MPDKTLINPNTLPATSAKQAKHYKSIDDANRIVKKSSLIGPLFGSPDDERIALRNALVQALMNRPKLNINQHLNNTQQTISDNYFSEIGNVFREPNQWGTKTPEEVESMIQYLVRQRAETLKRLPNMVKTAQEWNKDIRR